MHGQQNIKICMCVFTLYHVMLLNGYRNLILSFKSHIPHYFVFFTLHLFECPLWKCRSQWTRGLRCGSAAAHLLRSWVRIPPGLRKFVCCDCCVLSSRGLCDKLITHPQDSYRLWCVVVCGLETLWMRRTWLTVGGPLCQKKISIHCELKHYITAECVLLGCDTM